MFRRREVGGLAGALLVHAAAFPLLSIVPRRAPSGSPSADRAPDAEMAIEIDVANPQPLELLPSPPLPSEPQQAVAEGAHPPIRAPGPMHPDVPAEPAAAPAPDDAFDPGGAAWLGGAAPPMRRDPAAGSGVHAVPGDRPPSEQPPADPGRKDAVRIEHVIHEALVAHDHNLGLDAAGALVGLAEDSVRSTEGAPLDGKAYLDVNVNPDGTVANVLVVYATTPAATWQAVASRLRETARSRSVLWRKTGKPLRVRIEVSSRWVLPSGSHPGKVLSSPYTKTNETWQTGTGDWLPAFAASAVAGGARFDVSDVGARPLRDVHARILKEQ
jgi:hypothetical protein